MPTSIPCIPENAPFTPEQRAWLNGLFAGIFSEQPQPAPAAPRQSHRIAVLYASQSGTAEGLARKLAKELKAQGHVPAVATLVGYSPAALAAEKYAILLASTYGDGDAPDGVEPFYEQLCLEHFPRFENLSYAVFALGDRHYEHFCKFGCQLDTKLISLGANPLMPRVDCDVDVDEPFTQWKAGLLARFHEIEGGTKAANSSRANIQSVQKAHNLSDLPAPPATRENPALVPLVEKTPLTRHSSTKVTLHLGFSTEGTGLTYEAGDAFGVIPHNDVNLVAEILQVLRCNGNEMVPGAKTGMTTLHDALTHHLQITRLSRKLVQEFATLGQCAKLLMMLAPENKTLFEDYIHGRGVIDLLLEFPGVFSDPAELVAMLPRLSPRLYSISSSPLAHAGQIHATVAVVRYSAHDRERGGVCSTLFADRAKISDHLPIYIQPNRKFRLPSDDAPMIMIGPGTGIAPFRGFLHERRALGAKGRNWLFFGERSSATSFLYREELEAMRAEGHLTRLDTAFSRDQEHKVYVQDRMIEQGRDVWEWLEAGASLYVCGDATRMAKDVHAALLTLVAAQGGKSPEAAEEYVHQLKEQHRYHRDVY